MFLGDTSLTTLVFLKRLVIARFGTVPLIIRFRVVPIVTASAALCVIWVIRYAHANLVDENVEQAGSNLIGVIYSKWQFVKSAKIFKLILEHNLIHSKVVIDHPLELVEPIVADVVTSKVRHFVLKWNTNYLVPSLGDTFLELHE